MIDQQLDRVSILIEQGRHKDAEIILKDILSANPSNDYIMYLLAEVYLKLDKITAAETLNESAIALAPAEADYLYQKAKILLANDKSEKALHYAREAVSLNSEDPDYYALVGHILIILKEYDKALNAANIALQLDSSNVFALNVRSKALIKLDLNEEAFSTIEDALYENPNNDYTHANYGWGLLEKGENEKALIHFKEALVNNPKNEYAQAGLLEAIKATNFVYRWFLKYYFWLGNKGKKYQWSFIIGIYLLTTILGNISEGNTLISSLVYPIYVLLILFAISTWIISPIANLFLRFNKYGLILLSKEEKNESTFVAFSLSFAVLNTILYLITKNDNFIAPIIFGICMMIPLSNYYSQTKVKNLSKYITLVMLAVGFMAIYETFISGYLFNIYFNLFILFFIVYQWTYNYFQIK